MRISLLTFNLEIAELPDPIVGSSSRSFSPQLLVIMKSPFLSSLLAALIVNLTVLPSVAALAPASENKASATDFARLHERGLSRFSKGKYKSAEKYLKAALALSEGNASKADYNATLTDLANVRTARGHYTQAYDDYKEALDRSHSMTVNRACILEKIGKLNYMLGNMPQASDQLKESVEIFERAKAPTLNEAHALIDLCEVESELENFDKAKAAGEKALAISQKLSGDQSLDVCRSLNALAKMALFACRPRQAEDFLSRAIGIPAGKSRQEALLYSDCLNMCALTYLDESRVQEAQQVGQQALGIRQEYCGENHPLTGESLATLGIVDLCLKDYASAKSLLDRSLRICEKSIGENSRLAAKLCLAQGTASLLVQSRDEAGYYFARAQRIAHKLDGSQDPEITRIDSVAGAYFWQSANFVSVAQIKLSESFGRNLSKTAADPIFRCMTALIVKGPEAVSQHFITAQTPTEPQGEQMDWKYILAVLLFPIGVCLYFTITSNRAPALAVTPPIETSKPASADTRSARASYSSIPKASNTNQRLQIIRKNDYL